MQLPPLVIEHPQGSGLVIFDVFAEGEDLVCGLRLLEGKFPLPSKAWVRAVRMTMTEFENRARDAGCTEMRVSGRDWSRVLTDYEFIEGDAPNLLRKRLVDG